MYQQQFVVVERDVEYTMIALLPQNSIVELDKCIHRTHFTHLPNINNPKRTGNYNHRYNKFARHNAYRNCEEIEEKDSTNPE